MLGLSYMDRFMFGYARPLRGLPLAKQVQVLRRAGCSEFFASSRASDVELTMALRYARAGYVLVVCRLDCLNMMPTELAEFLKKLQTCQVYFVSLREGIDTRTELGQQALQLLATLAKLRSEEFSIRTKLGLAKARKDGRIGGRPGVMSNRKLIMARELLAAGQLSMSEIARRVGVARGTLYNAGLAARSSIQSNRKGKNKGRPRGAA